MIIGDVMRWKRFLVLYSFLPLLVFPEAASGQFVDPRPADLVDLERIKALSLAELGWQEEDRLQIGQVRVLKGSWRGPRFKGVSASWQEVELDLSEYAAVYLPLHAPEGAEIHQVVVGAHYASNAEELFPAGTQVVGNFPLAFIVHGEKEEDWISLGFEDRNEVIARSFTISLFLNLCEPTDYRTGNFSLALAETDMMALTLLSRLLEGEGYLPGPAAMSGLSKEGWAAWFASAVDDRLVAAAPGGMHLQDFVGGLTAEEENWGCEGEGAAGASIDILLLLRNWLASSPGGEVARKFISVVEFIPDLLPEFFLLHGDVGLHGLHDGTFFTPGAETPFLESFSAKPFRYDRKPDSPPEERESELDWLVRVNTVLAHYLVTRDLSSYPKVEESHVETESDRFRASARVNPVPEAVRLWWSHSDDRPFDDEGNAPWISVPMDLEGERWISPWVGIPEGQMIGWYVEAEKNLVWGDMEFPRRDTSPQRFFNEFPPLSCPDTFIPECTPFLRGDPNGDGAVDLGDPLTIIFHLFLGDPQELPCEKSADFNDSGGLDVTDAIDSLKFLFTGGSEPREPFKNCSSDPSIDGLSCGFHSPCE